MDKAVSFSYFYGEESEQFRYYRIPRLLITGAQFKNLSTDAKLLYGLFLDRKMCIRDSPDPDTPGTMCYPAGL